MIAPSERAPRGKYAGGVLEQYKRGWRCDHRPKALGDIRGATYIYGMFFRFGLIDVPDSVKEKMQGKQAKV